ncbi:MAG: hypothetical protein ACI9Y7_000991, partial [Dokdonia sp.]
SPSRTPKRINADVSNPINFMVNEVTKEFID